MLNMATGYTLPPRPAHPSLEAYHHPHPHMSGHHPAHLSQGPGQTCVPSLIPPGIDPAQVDIRTFYPYQPNEVKHRKRTTRSQLRVLESVYTHDTKPNAMLRKKLAEELEMTPRGVQVWFQNRRAKEKNIAKKLDTNGMSTTSAVPSTTPSTPATRTPSLSSIPPLHGADNHGSPSDVLAEEDRSISGNSASTLQTQESFSLSSNHGESERSRSQSVAGPSLALPTVPILPNIDDIPRIDAPDGSPSSSGSSPHSHNDWPNNNFYSPASVAGDDDSYRSVGLEMGLGLSAAEILAQRRPSLPILSLSSPSSLSSPMACPSAAPNMGMRAPGRLAGNSSNLSPGSPSGFDPTLRRRSVDTNIRRLSGHPYAPLAQHVSRHASHGAGFSQVPGGSYPSPMLSRRSYSQAHAELEPTSEDLSAQGSQSQGRTYFITPTPAHSQQAAKAGQNANQSPHQRPMLTQRMSMPSIHQEHYLHQPPPPPPPQNVQSHPQTPQTATSAATNGYGLNLGMFTNPFQSTSAGVSPGASASSTHGTPPSSGYETPVSPHVLPPASPSTSVSLLPIAHSFGSPLAGSMTRRYQRHDSHDLTNMANYAISFRTVQPPGPGPLPDAEYSFGLPGPASSSPLSGSPGALNEAQNGLGQNGNGVVEDDGDDASAVSSTYDPLSRFGSMASMADSVSSWTSAYCSDVGQQSRKHSNVEGLENYDAERRGSIAGHLPLLFGGLDVNGGSTPQPLGDTAVSSEQQQQHQHPGCARRASSGSAHGQQQQAYADAYQTAPDAFSPHLQLDAFAAHDQTAYGHASSEQELYTAEQGSYSPSSTISARSQNDVAGGEGLGDQQQQHSTPAPMSQHSRSSELMYALHSSTGIEDPSVGQGKLAYTSLNGSEHHLSSAHGHQQFSAISPKTPHYPSQTYQPQGDVSAYPDMAQQHVSSGYQPPELNFSYDIYAGTPIYANNAVELDSMCVPASMTMEGIQVGNYLHS